MHDDHPAFDLPAPDIGPWRAGNTAETRRWTDMVLADPQTPSSTRNQVEMLIALSDQSGKS